MPNTNYSKRYFIEYTYRTNVHVAFKSCRCLLVNLFYWKQGKLPYQISRYVADGNPQQLSIDKSLSGATFAATQNARMSRRQTTTQLKGGASALCNTQGELCNTALVPWQSPCRLQLKQYPWPRLIWRHTRPHYPRWITHSHIQAWTNCYHFTCPILLIF